MTGGWRRFGARPAAFPCSRPLVTGWAARGSERLCQIKESPGDGFMTAAGAVQKLLAPEGRGHLLFAFREVGHGQPGNSIARGSASANSDPSMKTPIAPSG